MFVSPIIQFLRIFDCFELAPDKKKMADARGKICCACVVVLPAIHYNNIKMPFVGSSSWISLTDALSPWILP